MGPHESNVKVKGVLMGSDPCMALNQTLSIEIFLRINPCNYENNQEGSARLGICVTTVNNHQREPEVEA